MIKTVSDDNFDKEINNAKTPVLVEFHASWSGPCRALAPILEQIEKDYGKLVKIVIADANESPISIKDYNVHAFPTFLLLLNGVLVKRLVGYASQEELEQFLEKNNIIKNRKKKQLT